MSSLGWCHAVALNFISICRRKSRWRHHCCMLGDHGVFRGRWICVVHEKDHWNNAIYWKAVSLLASLACKSWALVQVVYGLYLLFLVWEKRRTSSCMDNLRFQLLVSDPTTSIFTELVTPWRRKAGTWTCFSFPAGSQYHWSSEAT